MDVAKTQLVNHVNLCVDYLLFTVLCLSLIVDFLTDGNVIPLLYLFALDGLNHEQLLTNWKFLRVLKKEREIGNTLHLDDQAVPFFFFFNFIVAITTCYIHNTIIGQQGLPMIRDNKYKPLLFQYSK